MTDTKRKRTKSRKLRARSRLGKYRIESCLCEGSYANVYRAFDTIEQRQAALKIPHVDLADEAYLESYRKEVRLSAKIDHPRIVGIKDASFIGPMFVMAYPLGTEALSDRLARRISVGHLNLIILHAIEALAELHSRKIIHCDIKPENFILFPGPELKLADLGIARLSMRAMRTMRGSGSGTLGHMAPDQAMGRPSARSDVFALGLVLYRMVAGKLPEYPFDWPLPNYERLKRRARPQFVAILRKCLQLNPKKRYRDGNELLAAFAAIRHSALRQTK